MVIGIGIFVVGLLTLALIGALIGAALLTTGPEGFSAGMVIAILASTLLGVYRIGKFVAVSMGWI